MNEQEVKEYIGTTHWDAFLDFMYGQTVGVNEDGSIVYYEADVERFKRMITWEKE